MQYFMVKTAYNTYDGCTYSKGVYGNKHVAIQLYCSDGPLATLTTNIPGIEKYPKNYSCVDTNNCPWGEDLIDELSIGQFTGEYLCSGYCRYPVYKFSV